MNKNLAFAFVAIVAASVHAMTWSIDPSNGNQIIDDTGSWTLKLGNFNQTYGDVQYTGKAIEACTYSENGANGVLDLTTVEDDTGMKIVSTGENRWQNSTVLKEIYFPDTVVYFGRELFRGCTTVEMIRLPTSVVRMNGDRQFESCTALKSIYYAGVDPQDGVVVLPPCFEALSEFMFSSVPMTQFRGTGVKYVQRSCFSSCTALVSAEFSPDLVALCENNGNWTHSAFHNDQIYLSNLVDLKPSTLTESFTMQGSSLSIPFNNVSRTFKGTGWISNTAITNYFDFAACSFARIDEFAFYKTAIAGATIPATVEVIGNRAFNSLPGTATFRFLGAPPEFQNNNNGSQSVFYQEQQNQVGYRHTLVVDAAAYPAWTNAVKFVAVADFATNSIVNNAYSWSGTSYPADFPTPRHPEETLGVATWGFEGNTGDAARYAWLVQYVDHSIVQATWMNGDTEFASSTVATGGAPTAPAGTPTKASTDQYDYVFLGWNTDASATTALDLSTLSITDATTFHAIYRADVRSYTITWQMDDGTLIDTTTVAYGETPAHSDAAKAGDGTYTYSFSGWSTDGATVLASLPAVTGVATYIAVFAQHDASTTATVSWFDENGTTPLDPAQTTVTIGEQPTHAAPTKAATIDTSYTFDGWIDLADANETVVAPANLPNATVDVSYKAHYASATRQYTVTFANWDGSVVSALAYDYQTPASSVVVPGDPTRPATAEYTYAFTGWEPAAVADVTGDATYTAQYSQTANEYTAIFVNGADDTEISRATFAYGAAVTAPEPPTVEGKTFVSWSPAIGTMPAADATYTAVYETSVYTITWRNANGATIDTTRVSHGETPTHANPTLASTTKMSYAFAGWSPAIEAAVSNTTYTATYTGTLLASMSIKLTDAGSDYGAYGDGVATVRTTLVDSGAATTTVDADAAFRSVESTGSSDITALPAVVTTFDDFIAGRGYDWTITVTQTYEDFGGVGESAAIKGRSYARRVRTWFGNDSVAWEDNEFAPASASPSGVQVRLHATVTHPGVLPRALPDAAAVNGAAVGVAVYQPNAGVAPRYYAWNGTAWVKLVGVMPKPGESVTLLGVVDFARKIDSASRPAVAWYADGHQLTTEDGDWEVELTGSAARLQSFKFAGDAASVTSLEGDFDVGGTGLTILVR